MGVLTKSGFLNLGLSCR